MPIYVTEIRSSEDVYLPGDIWKSASPQLCNTRSLGLFLGAIKKLRMSMKICRGSKDEQYVLSICRTPIEHKRSTNLYSHTCNVVSS